jgi:hypothetical protein
MGKISDMSQSHATDWAINGWEHLSYLFVVIGAIASTGFLVMLIWQIRQGQKGLKAANRSAKAANAAVKEASRARIDAKTPKVIAILDKPLLHVLDTPKSVGSNANQVFVMPRMKDDTQYLAVDGTLINEGSATAKVRLNGNARFHDSDDDDIIFETKITDNTEYILPPGEKVKFTWIDGHTIQDWTDAYTNSDPPNPHGACFMEIIVSDFLEDGIIDHIFLEMAGRILAPVDGEDGRWKFNDESGLTAIAYPIHRTYRSEGWKGLTPPWVKVYEKWHEKNQ